MMSFKRVILYAVGLLFMAFGVAFSVNSNLGVSPVNSLPYVLSKIIHMDLGNCVILVFSCYILIFGYFVDLAKWMVGDFAIPTYAGQLLMLAISILLVAIGVSLYMGVKLVNMPMEGMTHAISEKILKKLPFHDVKVIMDCLSVGIGIVLSFVFLGKLEGIREGTVICALLVEKIMKPLKKVIDPMIQKFCFQK